jgi:hypothetical protein
MKRFVIVWLSLFVIVNIMISDIGWAQRAKIVMEAMSPHKLSEKGWVSNVSPGLNVVSKGAVVYMSARDLLGGTITSVLWEMIMRPPASTATLDSTDKIWTTFRTDTTGQFQIRLTITTSAGTNSTTMNVFSAKYAGVGGVGGVPPNIAQGQCAGCHGGSFPGLDDKVSPWRTSAHATMFQRGIDGAVAPYYSSGCIRCHTTGYDTQPTATNNNFYDQMQRSGWTFPSPLQPGNFDTLVARHPQLAQVATIGCESCHGPGSLHFGDATKTGKSLGVGVCAQCHDEPWRHPIVGQWENSGHAEPVYSSSFRQLPTNPNYRTNNFDNCVRCHDAEGFINLTKGQTTATDSLFAFNLNQFSCQMCHEPHGDTQNPYLLRRITADTLRNGYAIPTTVGTGGLCMNCHKTRRVGETYPVTTAISSTFGPHYAGTTDMLLGQNAHTFGQNIPSSVAHRLVQNTCVGCHMSATPDTGQVGRDKIGGHSWKMTTIVGGQEVDHVRECQTCHGPMNRFTDIIAAFDYDGDGVIEPFIEEVKGLKSRLAMAIPPYGVDSVAWSLIRSDPDSVRLKKAYYNYLFVKYDGSDGIHNPKYAIGLLQRSLTVLTGVEFEYGEGVPMEYALDQNYPNPFNPATTISFAIPKTSTVRLQVFDILGREVTTLVNEEFVPGNYTVPWDGSDHNGLKVASGIYMYRIQAGEFVQVKKMVLMK